MEKEEQPSHPPVSPRSAPPKFPQTRRAIGAPNPIDPPELIKKKGWLQKKGGIRKNWKTRYFVLVPTIMRYYTGEVHLPPYTLRYYINNLIKSIECRWIATGASRGLVERLTSNFAHALRIEHCRWLLSEVSVDRVSVIADY